MKTDQVNHDQTISCTFNCEHCESTMSPLMSTLVGAFMRRLFYWRILVSTLMCIFVSTLVEPIVGQLLRSCDPLLCSCEALRHPFLPSSMQAQNLTLVAIWPTSRLPASHGPHFASCTSATIPGSCESCQAPKELVCLGGQDEPSSLGRTRT